MDGLDLLQQVKRLRPDVPVVIVTAQVDERAYAIARELGTVRYLLKPTTMDQLARAVENAAMLRAARVRSAQRKGGTSR
jgi:DNA-binding NtrC family response regulator